MDHFYVTSLPKIREVDFRSILAQGSGKYGGEILAGECDEHGI